MARHKRANPILQTVRQYLDIHMPELHNAPLHLRSLDGPPGSPRYAVTAEACTLACCPRGIPAAVAAAGNCSERMCPLRHSVRLLLDRRGAVIQAIRSQVHWG
jgi:hypothetical protein